MAKVTQVTAQGKNAVIVATYEYQEYAGANYKEATIEIPLTIENVECLIERLNACLDKMRASA